MHSLRTSGPRRRTFSRWIRTSQSRLFERPFCSRRDFDSPPPFRWLRKKPSMSPRSISTLLLITFPFVNSVDKCLKMCGLEGHADAIVGSLGVEHRKRTTIGVELAAKVSILNMLPMSRLVDEGRLSRNCCSSSTNLLLASTRSLPGLSRCSFANLRTTDRLSFARESSF